MSRFVLNRRVLGLFCAVAVSAGNVAFIATPAAHAADWGDILKPLIKDVIVPGASMGMKKLMEKHQGKIPGSGIVNSFMSDNNSSSDDGSWSSSYDESANNWDNSGWGESDSGWGNSDSSWGDSSDGMPQEPMSNENGNGSMEVSSASSSSDGAPPPPPPVATP